MTDKHMYRDDAGLGVGERRLVPIGQAPVVLPETLAGELDESIRPGILGNSGLSLVW